MSESSAKYALYGVVLGLALGGLGEYGFKVGIEPEVKVHNVTTPSCITALSDADGLLNSTLKTLLTLGGKAQDYQAQAAACRGGK